MFVVSLLVYINTSAMLLIVSRNIKLNSEPTKNVHNVRSIEPLHLLVGKAFKSINKMIQK